MNDQVITVDYALTVRTDQFGGLQYGDQVQHEGQTYKLQHEPLRQADGRFSVMVLELVALIPDVVFEVDVFVPGVFV